MEHQNFIGYLEKKETKFGGEEPEEVRSCYLMYTHTTHTLGRVYYIMCVYFECVQWWSCVVLS